MIVAGFGFRPAASEASLIDALTKAQAAAGGMAQALAVRHLGLRAGPRPK